MRIQVAKQHNSREAECDGIYASESRSRHTAILTTALRQAGQTDAQLKYAGMSAPQAVSFLLSLQVSVVYCYSSKVPIMAGPRRFDDKSLSPE